MISYNFHSRIAISLLIVKPIFKYLNLCITFNNKNIINYEIYYCVVTALASYFGGLET